MPVTYITRRGRTYHLCQGATASGKPRYYFSSDPKDTPLDRLPEGYEIHETVNGVVTIRRAQPPLLTKNEVALVHRALADKPKPHRYPMDVARDRIIIYEKQGPDWVDLPKTIGLLLPLTPGHLQRLRDQDQEQANYGPVLRIILEDGELRTFRVEHIYVRNGPREWVAIPGAMPLRVAVSEYVKTIGTPAFDRLTGY